VVTQSLQSSAQVLEEIRRDNVSGASEVSRKGAAAFVLFAAENRTGSKEEYFRSLLKLGADLVSAQPHMASIFNLANSILFSIEESLTLNTTEELAELTRQKAEEFIRKSLGSVQLIARTGESLVLDGSKVLTFSSSGSILAILKKAKEMGKSFQVVVCESRPMLEGRLLAKFLGNAKIPVTLIADAAMGFFGKDVDLYLVGADSISEEVFVNKIGTFGLGLLSREYEIPLYVACERSKFIARNWRIAPFADSNPSEVLEDELLNVRARNPYFEEIPLSFCRQVITNEGFLPPSEISNYIRKTRLSKKLMQLLKRPVSDSSFS
jgi:translation initiation factor 2B subunit (eIF-2B alpha/beta/delta family)